jgi:hypothetical protein
MECPHCGAKLYLSLVKMQSETESIERRQEWLDAIASAELREANQDGDEI